MVALRDRVVATVTPGIGEAQVRAVITLKDGRRLEKYIEHVVGSVERPMSDADLDAKFLDLADGVLVGRARSNCSGSAATSMGCRGPAPSRLPRRPNNARSYPSGRTGRDARVRSDRRRRGRREGRSII